MQHIVNLAFEFDDEDLINSIKRSAETSIIKNITDKVIKELHLDQQNSWRMDEYKAKISKNIADSIMTEEFINNIILRIVRSISNRQAFINAVSQGALKELLNKDE